MAFSSHLFIEKNYYNSLPGDALISELRNKALYKICPRCDLCTHRGSNKMLLGFMLTKEVAADGKAVTQCVD